MERVPDGFMLNPKDSLKTLPLGRLFSQGLFTAEWGAMGAAMMIVSLAACTVQRAGGWRRHEL